MEKNLKKAFALGDYQTVIDALGKKDALDVAQQAMLGIALLRTGQFSACELTLARAMSLGSLEASVEYGNLLRITSQNEKAVRHFEKVLPSLDGELRFRALRWYGVALFACEAPHSLDIVYEARLGYLSLHDDTTAARINHTLAALLLSRAEFRQVKELLEQAIPTLAGDTNPRPLLNAYQTLTDALLELGELEEAQETLEQAEAIAKGLQDSFAQFQVDARRSLLRLKQGDYGAFARELSSLRERANTLGEVNIYTFASNNLANHLSRIGDHAGALRILAELKQRFPNRSVETLLVSAMLTLRRGDAPNALGQLLRVRETAREQNNLHDATRATLLAAFAAYSMNDFDLALSHLSEGLQELAGWSAISVKVSMREELNDIHELLAHAQNTPRLQPIIAAALERTTALVMPTADDLYAPQRTLQLNVLGPYPLALIDGLPLQFRLTYSLPILTYLALHPQRTRQEITADLWGDQATARTAANFRQCLTEIRRVCGADLIVMEGPYREPRYALSKRVIIHLDTQQFQQRLDELEASELVSHYKGEFLARLPETEWLQEMRSTITGSLILRLKAAIDYALSRGDDRQVVRLATSLLDVDPEDLEIEALRFERAQLVCSASEVAKFQAALHRRLN